MKLQDEPKRQQYAKPVLRVVDFKPEERLMGCSKVALQVPPCATQNTS